MRHSGQGPDGGSWERTPLGGETEVATPKAFWKWFQ